MTESAIEIDSPDNPFETTSHGYSYEITSPEPKKETSVNVFDFPAGGVGSKDPYDAESDSSDEDVPISQLYSKDLSYEDFQSIRAELKYKKVFDLVKSQSPDQPPHLPTEADVIFWCQTQPFGMINIDIWTYMSIKTPYYMWFMIYTSQQKALKETGTKSSWKDCCIIS